MLPVDARQVSPVHFRSSLKDNTKDLKYFPEALDIIAKSLRGLSKKEQMVVSLYYYDELTLKEIGEVMGLTESRISQIHTKSIVKLRTKLKQYRKA